MQQVRIKNLTCYYLHDIIKLEDSYFYIFLIDEKSHEIILIYDISYKTLIVPKPLRFNFVNVDGFLEFI